MQDHSKYYFRFALEVIAIVFVGIWGANLSTGWGSFFIGLGCSIVFVTIWGVFNVPNDPSRSGKAPVVVSGKLRLILEFTLFTWAAVAIAQEAGIWFGIVFLLAVIAHNIHIKERTIWIWQN